MGCPVCKQMVCNSHRRCFADYFFVQISGVAMNIYTLASKTGFRTYQEQAPGIDGVVGNWEDLEAFAKLVAAYEREECAKLFETITKDPAVPPVHFSLADTAKLIRARGEV